MFQRLSLWNVVFWLYLCVCVMFFWDKVLDSLSSCLRLQVLELQVCTTMARNVYLHVYMYLSNYWVVIICFIWNLFLYPYNPHLSVILLIYYLPIYYLSVCYDLSSIYLSNLLTLYLLISLYLSMHTYRLSVRSTSVPPVILYCDSRVTRGENKTIQLYLL